ncbi:hypothetical protein E0H35_30425 [Rhizobium leguminosarum bv. viciae]|uniref:hypothetical protein n=1 Tax=Rhizobium leguminosarum TaxID=384 RepID=UPI0010387A7E|nr:hypothetical protein [Rhizobium leguminosarum]MBY5340411.1 hypothetical protein [Rhizobium leguminosarum]NKK49311.1 hypothetical protein [Rhizobium leguminosarum bv. viciae]TBY90852.1 hypothetical protein E0H35_30425 [Rhizobium leguminosarum bv. viciae]
MRALQSAAWGAYSGGRNAEYPYYFCLNKKCLRYRKSFSRDEMHAHFEALLKKLTPSDEMIDIATAIFREVWEKRSEDATERSALLRRDANATDRSIGLLIDRIANSTNPQLVDAYEARLVDLQREKATLVEKIENSEKTMPDFDNTLRTAIAFLASPWKLWKTGKLEDQRAVRKLVFSEHLQYAPELGFRTAETTLPFKVLADIAADNVQVVRWTRFEPRVRFLNAYGRYPFQVAARLLSTKRDILKMTRQGRF